VPAGRQATNLDIVPIVFFNKMHDFFRKCSASDKEQSWAL